MSKTEKQFKVVEVDGLYFQKRTAAVENGKKHVADILVPYPTTMDELQEFIDKGKETEVHAINLYVGAKAIELQRQARSAAKSDKVPQTVYDRIVNSISADEIARIWKESDNPRAALDAIVQKAWAAEKEAAQVAQESDQE
jgi:hypothetical protein